VRTKYFMCATIRAAGKRAVLGYRPRASVAGRGELLASKSFLLRARRSADGFTARRTLHGLCGPVEYDLLKKYGVGLEDLVDLGWRWLVRPFSLVILWLFKVLHGLVPNYGFVIILFSLIIKIIFHPLTKKSMPVDAADAVAPAAHGEAPRTPQRRCAAPQSGDMKLYKEAGINPISGCLPCCRNPIFYGLFQVFRTTISCAAHTSSAGSRSVTEDPYYILPIIMTVSFFLQQRLSTKDPSRRC